MTNTAPLLKTSLQLLILLSMMLLQVASAEKLTLPDSALGLVMIKSPKVGSLLQLRGIAGNGYLIQRVSDSSCLKSRIKIAAGDFGGKNISIKKAKPILLAIYSPKAMKALKKKDEIVSEDYKISTAGQPHGDIEILLGLLPTQGFVINPAEWSVFHLFSNKPVKVDCD
jgi:hypothetical protein